MRFPSRRIQTGRQSSAGRSLPLSTESLVNLYPEAAPNGGVSQVVVHGIPGLTLFADIDSRRVRGMHKTLADGVLYVVIRNTLYRINESGNFTSLGVIAGSGRVGMADNGRQLCIVAGASGYTYSVDNGLVQILDDGFMGANTVGNLDGFFIFNNPNAGQRGQFYISDLLDGQVFDATDFASAERFPDNLLAVFPDHSELLLFGSDSIEVWFNAGAPDFPFRRAQGSVIEQGLGAVHSIAKLDESVVWLDNEGMIRRLEGNIPIRISTHAIEFQISRGDWANATAWSYVQEGHQFYVLTVPARELNQNAGTYVYDAATQLWHERKSYRQDYWRAGFYAFAYGQHIVADIDTGRLYTMNLDVYEDAGDPIVSEMQLPPIENNGNRFIVHELELHVETGTFDVPQSRDIVLTSELYPVETVESLNPHATTAAIPPNHNQIDNLSVAPTIISVETFIPFNGSTEFSPESLSVNAGSVGINTTVFTFSSYDDYAAESLNAEFNDITIESRVALFQYEEYAPESISAQAVSITIETTILG